MRVYLKSGQSFRIKQKEADAIVEMIVGKEGIRKGLLTRRSKFNSSLTFMIKIKEVVAIK